MTHLPLAFSIHHFISSVGADAGFASIIGLAILVLLYFAQARETATLRDRADNAEERAAQLEARLSQVAHAARTQGASQPAGPRPVPSPIARPLANPTPAATPAASPASTAASGSSAAVATAVPHAPAGVGAPALIAATRLIPLPAATGPAQPHAATPAPAPAPAPVVSPEPVAASGPAPATAAGAASATAVAAPPAAPPTGGGNGSSGNTAQRPPLDEPLDEPLPRVQLRSGGGDARHLPPLRQPPSSRGPSRFGRGLAALLAVLGVAAVVAVLLIATSGGGKNAPSGSTSTSNAPGARHKAKSKAFNKGAVTVTVLNGTGTSGLAATILTQLGHAGFKKGTAANAANATQTTSAIAYLPGQKVAAQAVAKALKLPAATVAPIDSNTRSIACTQPTCNVDVVVTVGQDLVGH